MSGNIFVITTASNGQKAQKVDGKDGKDDGFT